MPEGLKLELSAKSGSLDASLDRIAQKLDQLVEKSQRFAESLTSAFRDVGIVARQVAVGAERIGKGVDAALKAASGLQRARGGKQDLSTDDLFRKQIEVAEKAHNQIVAFRAKADRADEAALVKKQKTIEDAARVRTEVENRVLAAQLKQREAEEAQFRAFRARADKEAAASTTRTEKQATDEALETFRSAQRSRAQLDAVERRRKEEIFRDLDRLYEESLRRQAQREAATQRALEAQRRAQLAQRRAQLARIESETRNLDRLHEESLRRQAQREAATQRALDAQRRAQLRALDAQRRAQLARIESETRAVQNRIESFATRIGFAAFGALRQVVSRTVSVLTGGGLEAAFQRAADFEKNLADVGSLLQRDTLPILEAYRGALLRIAQTTSKDLVDLTRGLYEAISAGAAPTLKAGGALDIVNAAQKAAVAGLADTTEAVKALTIIFNTYGKSVGNASVVSNKLFEAVNIGVFTFPQLAGAIGKVANTAAVSGVSFDELLGALTLLTKNGVSVSQAVTQINRLLIAIERPTESAAKAAKQFGVELGGGTIRAKGFQNVIRELADLQTRFGTQTEEVLGKLVGGRVEAQRAILALVKERGTLLEQDVKTIAQGTTAIDRAFALQSQKIGFQLGVLRNKFDILSVEVFSKVEPVLVGFLERLGLEIEGVNQIKLTDIFVNATKGLTDFITTLITARESVVAVASFIKNLLVDTLIAGVVLAGSRAATALRGSLLGVVSSTNLLGQSLTTLAASGGGGVSGFFKGLVIQATTAREKIEGTGATSVATGGRLAKLATGTFIVAEALRLAATAGEAFGEALGKLASEEDERRIAAMTKRVRELQDATFAGRTEDVARARTEGARLAVESGTSLTEARRQDLQRTLDAQRAELKAAEERVQNLRTTATTLDKTRRDEIARAEEHREKLRFEVDRLKGVLRIGREVNEEDIRAYVKQVTARGQLAQDEVAAIAKRRPKLEREIEKRAELFRRLVSPLPTGKAPPLLPEQAGRGTAEDIRLLLEGTTNAAEKQIALLNSIAARFGEKRRLEVEDALEDFRRIDKQLTANSVSAENRARTRADLAREEIEATREGELRKAIAERQALAGAEAREKKESDLDIAGGKRAARQREFLADDAKALQAKLELEKLRLQVLRESFEKEIFVRQEVVDAIRRQAKIVNDIEEELARSRAEREVARLRQLIEGGRLSARALREVERELSNVVEKEGLRRQAAALQFGRTQEEIDREATEKRQREVQEVAAALRESIARVGEVRRRLSEEGEEARAEILQDVDVAAPLRAAQQYFENFETVLENVRELTRGGLDIPNNLEAALERTPVEQIGARLGSALGSALTGSFLSVVTPSQFERIGEEVGVAISSGVRHTRREAGRREAAEIEKSVKDLLERINQVREAMLGGEGLGAATARIKPLESILRISPEVVENAEGFAAAIRAITNDLTSLPDPASLQEVVRTFTKGPGAARAREEAGRAAEAAGARPGGLLERANRGVEDLAISASASLSKAFSGETFQSVGQKITDDFVKGGRAASDLLARGAAALPEPIRRVGRTVIDSLGKGISDVGDSLGGAVDVAASILKAGGAAAGAALTAGLNLLIGKVVEVFQKLVSLAGEFSATAGEAEQTRLREAGERVTDIRAQRAAFPRRAAEARLQAQIEEAKAKGLPTEGLESQLTGLQQQGRAEEARGAVGRLAREEEQLKREEEQARKEEAEAQRAVDLGPFRIAVEGEIRKLGTFVANLFRNLPNLAYKVILDLGEQLSRSILAALPDFIDQFIELAIGFYPDFIARVIDIVVNEFIGRLDVLIVKVAEALVNGIKRAISNVFSLDAGEGLLGLPGIPLLHKGGYAEYAEKIHRYAQGGFTRNTTGVTAEQHRAAREMFAQIRGGAVPALLERGELMVPPDVADAVGGPKVPIGSVGGIGAPVVNIYFQARNGLEALIQRLVSDAFVAQVQKEGGVNYRTARDVAEGKPFQGLPEVLPFVFG